MDMTREVISALGPRPEKSKTKSPLSLLTVAAITGALESKPTVPAEPKDPVHLPESSALDPNEEPFPPGRRRAVALEPKVEPLHYGGPLKPKPQPIDLTLDDEESVTVRLLTPKQEPVHHVELSRRALLEPKPEPLHHVESLKRKVVLIDLTLDDEDGDAQSPAKRARILPPAPVFVRRILRPFQLAHYFQTPVLAQSQASMLPPVPAALPAPRQVLPFDELFCQPVVHEDPSLFSVFNSQRSEEVEVKSHNIVTAPALPEPLPSFLDPNWKSRLYVPSPPLSSTPPRKQKKSDSDSFELFDDTDGVDIDQLEEPDMMISFLAQELSQRDLSALLSSFASMRQYARDTALYNLQLILNNCQAVDN